MDWSRVDYLLLWCIYQLILMAPIHCRGSIAEQVMICYISPYMWKNKIIYILVGLRVRNIFNIQFGFKVLQMYVCSCMLVCTMKCPWHLLSLSLSLNQHGWGLGSLTWLCRRTEPEVEARLSGQWLKSDDSRWEQVLPNTGPLPRRGQTGLVTRCLYPALRSSDLTRQGSRHSSLDCRREREWIPTRSHLASKNSEPVCLMDSV